MVSAVTRSLSRLSRDKLIELCISWTRSSKSTPYLALNRNTVETEEEDYLHDPAESRKDLKDIYTTLGNPEELESLSKKDIVDRIVDGDWRRGLTHNQLASIDFANLEENDSSLRWTALKLVPLAQAEAENNDRRPAKRRKIQHVQPAELPQYPDATVSVFVQKLKEHIAPLVKAHYYIHHLESLDLNIVRLYISPNAAFAPLSTNVPRQGKSSTESARTMYIALPSGCPYVYVSVSGATNPDKPKGKSAAPKVDIIATKRVVLEAIPKALSRSQQRWSLESTKLTAKSLKSISLLRGSGKVGTTGGSLAGLQACNRLSKNEHESELQNNGQVNDEEDVVEASRRQLVEQRFGPMSGPNHAKLDRVQVKVRSLNPISKKRKVSYDDDDNSLTPITITFSGSDVFAGLKRLALLHPEIVDVSKMPAALTGETRSSVVTI